MRRSPLQRRSRGRAREMRGRAVVREQVFLLDSYRCRLVGVDGAGACFGPLTPHHVLKASQGGTYTEDNLVTLCSSHNDRIEADADLAALAYGLGLVRRRGDVA